MEDVIQIKTVPQIIVVVVMQYALHLLQVMRVDGHQLTALHIDVVAIYVPMGKQNMDVVQ